MSKSARNSGHKKPAPFRAFPRSRLVSPALMQGLNLTRGFEFLYMKVLSFLEERCYNSKLLLPLCICFIFTFVAPTMP